MASLLEWQVIITAAITKTARKQHSTTTILSFIRGKSLRHVAMVAKNLKVNKTVVLEIWQNKTKKKKLA